MEDVSKDSESGKTVQNRCLWNNEEDIFRTRSTGSLPEEH
jgi:hypothetical protein